MGDVIAFQKKNVLTFEVAYEQFYEKILAFFCRKISNRADAEDLTEEVFTYCYKNWSSYDPEKASLSTWIYLVANSRYKNYCRDHKMFVDIDERVDIADETFDDMEKALYVQELRRVLNNALENLTDRQRKIVVLKYFEGLGTDEIAGLLQSTPNNVRVQLSKALKNMKKILAEKGINIDG